MIRTNFTVIKYLVTMSGVQYFFFLFPTTYYAFVLIPNEWTARKKKTVSSEHCCCITSKLYEHMPSLYTQNVIQDLGREIVCMFVDRMYAARPSATKFIFKLWEFQCAGCCWVGVCRNVFSSFLSSNT